MLAMLLLAAQVFTCNQGQLVPMTLPDEPGVQSMVLAWEGSSEGKPAEKRVPFAKAQGAWRTVVGVDLETSAGDHSGNIIVTFADGRKDQRPVTIRVQITKFPTTQLKVADKYVNPSPPDQKRVARDTKELNDIYSKITPQILWAKPFVIPIPGQTKGSNFGNRRIFNGQSRAPHAGSDLKASTGTPIHATNRGRVVLAKNLYYTGNTVVLDHGLGVYTIYAHLSRIDVKLEQMVDDGHVLGLAGATGRVTGPHLHWSARIQGARVDPFSLLSIE